ncbi:unnamed protein product [Cylicocyclus nassatus]|uniref:Uncharacterized protein n=1 Tax=Cylicocyclus nassatus TaxID=53992 RepID=A0AA36GR00_CYLNA|nr:unnamed protein product [Cylicocyclus nassatus]
MLSVRGKGVSEGVAQHCDKAFCAKDLPKNHVENGLACERRRKTKRKPKPTEADTAHWADELRRKPVYRDLIDCLVKDKLE